MNAYWRTLSHNGINFPEPYQPDGLSGRVSGRPVALSPSAEEMAYHLAKKKETSYIQDPVFASNFMLDFVKELPEWCAAAKFSDVDFSELFAKADREKAAREGMSKEEKKRLAASRKERREALKARYGRALLDGKEVEIANWTVEPPGLFMGRGQAPLRGRWKPRVSQADVILNLGESAPVPPGRWKEVVHDHNSMWMAKWVDKLTDKEKYVWLHESSPLQQSRNKAKYDNALKVGTHLEKIRLRIEEGMSAKEQKTRQVATVCFLIDRLGMRVGDEKDEDEADTVGATTLRVEHVKLEPGSIGFSFIGKDSVPWNKSLDRPPPVLRRALEDFTKVKRAEDLVFHRIDSGDVNSFLSGVVRGATAKVFRTYHATAVAESALRGANLSGADELSKLYHAKRANLEAAKFCNHQRTIPKTWEQSLAKKQERLKQLQEGHGSEKRARKLRMEVDFQVEAKNYNLNTSLKNYIDPRIFKSWCDHVGLDWAKVYSKAMQKKFSWAPHSSTRWEDEASTIQAVAQS